MWLSVLEFIQAHYSVFGAIFALLTGLFGMYLMAFGKDVDSRDAMQAVLFGTIIFTPTMYWLWGILIPIIIGVVVLIWFISFAPEQIFSLRRRIDKWQRDKKLRKTTYFP